MKIITPADYATLLTKKLEYDAILDEFTKRIDYIINFLVKKVSGELSWWSYMYSTEDNSMGNFFDSYSSDAIQLAGEWSHRSNMTIIDKDGDEWYAGDGEFPTRWLYEDFEDEYTNGLKLFKEKQEKETKKEKLTKAVKKKLAIQAAEKVLTKEQMKILGIK